MRSARELGPDDLIWDHFSRPRFEDVPTRIRAAAKAGFAGVGLYIGAYVALRDRPGELERIDDALDETGLVIADIEVVRGFASPDRPDEMCVELETMAYEMAARWSCRYLQAISMHTSSAAEAARGFASLCDRAADHGLLVGLEWVPQMTTVETVQQAIEIALRADRPNGGVCFDSWHLTRSGGTVDDLRSVPGEKIVSTQWNDGTRVPADPTSDYRIDCLTTRLAPGDGEFALVEMVQMLDAIGCTAPYGLEVCSAKLDDGPADAAAHAAADGMRRVVSSARRAR